MATDIRLVNICTPINDKNKQISFFMDILLSDWIMSFIYINTTIISNIILHTKVTISFGFIFTILVINFITDGQIKYSVITNIVFVNLV